MPKGIPNKKEEPTQNTIKTYKGFGLSREGNTFSVDRIEYKFDGTCKVESIYKSGYRDDAMNRFKIVSMMEIE